jgi:hypothetical protein
MEAIFYDNFNIEDGMLISRQFYTAGLEAE